ncbi:MAG: hypothetical protein OXT65_04065 [Alphaproteobacteria bacterium]|nr:hypothetical protein [Alphaproteobacteria bacterium]
MRNMLVALCCIVLCTVAIVEVQAFAVPVETEQPKVGELEQKDALPPEMEEELVACTMDAMECPDGSYVSRQAPDCSFAPCPEVTEEE